MKTNLISLFTILISCFLFFACNPDKDNNNSTEEDFIPTSGKFVRFQSGSLQWQALQSELGSGYVKTDNSENPQWYDIVLCSEDVNDFSIEHYNHHLFLHVDLDSAYQVEDFNIIYYKNKNTERQGDFELMLTKHDGTLTLSRSGDSLSGEFNGKMRNNASPNDIRQTQLIFRNLPIEAIN